jgi:hypothetical protein
MTINFENIPKLPSLTLSQLESLSPQLNNDNIGAIVYCSDAITSKGIGDIAKWNGSKWINSENSPLVSKQSDYLNYLRNNLSVFTDCLTPNASCFEEFLGTAISSGTINPPASPIGLNRFGLVRARSSTTANSGYLISTSNVGFVLKGSENFLAALLINSVATNITTTRLGFHDCGNSNDAVDGVYFEIVNSLISIKTSSNNVRTTTTFFTLAVNTYYIFSIVINSDATLAIFKIFNENGDVLATDTISTNIPKTAGRELGSGIISTNNGTTAVDLYTLDYIGFNYKPNRDILNL